MRVKRIFNGNAMDTMILTITMLCLASLNTTIFAQSNVAKAIFYNPTIKSQTDSLKIKQIVGFAIDLLPPILSASTGNFGISGQLWDGYKKIRISAELTIQNI